MKKVTIYIDDDNAMTPSTAWNDSFIDDIIKEIEEPVYQTRFGYVMGYSIEDINKPGSRP